ncbi:MAG: fumarylacetoacetate hydrolase family protein [Nitriliruptoraceae bacterium]
MRLAMLRVDGRELAAVRHPHGWLPTEPVAGMPPGGDLAAVLRGGFDDALRARVLADAAEAPADAFVPVADARFAPPFRHPRLVLGIGLNYRAHADDLGTPQTAGPASFLKADHTIVGDGDPIVLPDPAVAAPLTAAAARGRGVGRRAGRVDEADALAHVAAVCCVLDQTAEDVLQRDPRFLTRSKNHPTFLSFGPELVTLDEVLGADGSLDHLVVETVRNGEVHRAAPVADMAMRPAELVAFHSRVMPLEPGDLILTGTPGAAVVAAGDVMTCRIAGVGELTNPVVAG